MLKIREHGYGDFFEVELPESKKTMSGLLDIISEEFGIPATEIALLRKLPDILVRNDKDVRRLKNNQSLEFFRIQNVNIDTS